MVRIVEKRNHIDLREPKVNSPLSYQTSADRYKFDTGLAIIFNNINFQPQTEKTTRKGSEEDVKKLKTCFQTLGFHVDVYVDYKKEDIFWTLDRVSIAAEIDCVAIIIMTYGEEGKLWACDTTYAETDVFQMFRDKLRGIPKLFIFQSGREKSYTTPELPDNDMFAIWSTGINGRSYRNTVSGSFFIAGLTKQLQTLSGPLSLETVMEKAIVLVKKECRNNKVIQEPQFKNSLLKALYLMPRGAATD